LLSDFGNGELVDETSDRALNDSGHRGSRDEESTEGGTEMEVELFGIKVRVCATRGIDELSCESFNAAFSNGARFRSHTISYEHKMYSDGKTSLKKKRIEPALVYRRELCARRRPARGCLT
jgi:hypothetical protein